MKLSDKEILNFNDRLKDDRFIIKPEYTNTERTPVIAYYINPAKPHYGFKEYNGYNLQQIEEPVIDFTFHFSICEKRSEHFFEIFDKIKNSEIETSVYVIPEKKPIKVVFDENSYKSKNVSNHVMFNRNFIKIEYVFSTRVSSIMWYLKVI